MTSIAAVLILASATAFTVCLTYIVLTKRYRKTGVSTTGTIFVDRKRWNEGIMSSFPAVRFLTKDNILVEGRSELGNNPVLYREGREVEVLYKPGNPADFRVCSPKIMQVFRYALWVSVALFIGSFYYLSSHYFQ